VAVLAAPPSRHGHCGGLAGHGRAQSVRLCRSTCCGSLCLVEQKWGRGIGSASRLVGNGWEVCAAMGMMDVEKQQPTRSMSTSTGFGSRDDGQADWDIATLGVTKSGVFFRASCGRWGRQRHTQAISRVGQRRRTFQHIRICPRSPPQLHRHMSMLALSFLVPTHLFLRRRCVDASVIGVGFPLPTSGHFDKKCWSNPGRLLSSAAGYSRRRRRSAWGVVLGLVVEPQTTGARQPGTGEGGGHVRTRGCGSVTRRPCVG
jgi:hypothetical protein